MTLRMYISNADDEKRRTRAILDLDVKGYVPAADGPEALRDATEGYFAAVWKSEVVATFEPEGPDLRPGDVPALSTTVTVEADEFGEYPSIRVHWPGGRQ